MDAKHKDPVAFNISVSQGQLIFALSVGVLLGTVLLRAVLLRNYIFSSLLIHDDTVFIGSFMFGGPLSGPKAQEAFYSVLKFLASGGSEVPPKLFLLFIQAVILLSFYRIIVRFCGSHFMAAALALFATCYPVSVDQNYFMSGAHPTAATAVFLVFSVLYTESLFRGWIASKLTYFGFLVLQGALLYVCGFASPTFTLMPLILVPATVLAILVGPENTKISLSNLMLVVLSVTPMAVYYAAIHHHHYSDLVGWSDYSLDRILENFGEALGFIFLKPFKHHSLALAGYITGLAIVVIACLVTVLVRGGRAHRGHVNPKLLALLSVLLISSALTFGPSSILVQFTTRYIVPATMIAFLILAILVAKLVRRAQETSSADNMAIWAGVTLLAIVAVIHNVSRTSIALAPFQKSHALIEAALASAPVENGDQVLVILPGGYLTPTLGFNHWSTWYLRVLTGKPDVIGLVGADYMKGQLDASELFVDTYRDHGPEYWGIADGRSYRKRMKGLERGRRLFLLVPAETEELALNPLIFWQGQTLFVVPPGQAPDAMAVASGAGNMCASDFEGGAVLKDAVWITSDPRIPGADRFHKILKTSYIADALNSRTVSVAAKAGQLTLLRAVLSSQDIDQNKTGSTAYSSTYPPMPMKGPDYSVYLAGGGYRVLSKSDGVAQAQVPAIAGQDLDISMIGCPGSFALLNVNGEFVGVIPEASFSGNWLLGQGFLERYWAGHIKSFSVAVVPD